MGEVRTQRTLGSNHPQILLILDVCFVRNGSQTFVHLESASVTTDSLGTRSNGKHVDTGTDNPSVGLVVDTQCQFRDIGVLVWILVTGITLACTVIGSRTV